MQKAFTFPWQLCKFCTNIVTPRSFRSKVVGRYFASSKVKLSSVSGNITKYNSEKIALQIEFNKYKDQHIDQAFFLANVGAAKRQYDQWIKELPRVVPFYAVKCNPDRVLVSTLHKKGAKFDCASANEIKLCLSLGVSPENILFANPVKNIIDLQYAASVDVNKMTFDNEYELDKIVQYHPQAELIIRLCVDDSTSIMKFNSKFGAKPKQVPNLLLKAQLLNLKVVGTSFHIGSGCYNPQAYDSAIKLSKHVHDLALHLGFPRFTILDIGGGFSGTNKPIVMSNKVIPTFSESAAVIRKSLDVHFPQDNIGNKDLIVYAEPGRYLATQFQTIFTNIYGKRKDVIVNLETNKRQEHMMYYINNGTYDAFNCVYNDHYTPTPILLDNLLKQEEQQKLEKHSTWTNKNQYIPTIFSGIKMLQPKSQKLQYYHKDISKYSKPQYISTFQGNSCDARDCIVRDVLFQELSIGDWIAFENMGAYTNASGSTFNGFKKAAIYYYES